MFINWIRRKDMSYLGLSEDHWMFCSSSGIVYGVPLSKALSYGDAYEQAFSHFFG